MEAPTKDIQSIQETMTKAYKRLWNDSFDELLEEFEMQIMPILMMQP
jgi:hypothetical protein